MSQPGFYFYTGDWLKDTRTLSLEARGAWIDLLCALNEAGGSVTWPLRAFDQYWGTISHNGIEYSASEILEELSALGVCNVTKRHKVTDGDSLESVTLCHGVTDGSTIVTVMSRRIQRDANYKESHRKRQQRYRERRSRDACVTELGDGSSSSESYSSLISSSKKKKISTPRPRSNSSPSEWPSPEQLVELYNTLTPDECPAVSTLSPARRAKAKQYLQTFPEKQFWEQVFDRVHHSRFLRGQQNKNGHGSFRFDFDWMLTKGKDGSENCLKVQEGRYADER